MEALGTDAVYLKASEDGRPIRPLHTVRAKPGAISGSWEPEGSGRSNACIAFNSNRYRGRCVSRTS